MASFDWASCVIDVSTRNGGQFNGTLADVAGIPTNRDATISFAHEYIHYLQAIGSVAGARILGELVEIAVAGALLLQGAISDQGGVVTGYRPIIGELQKHADHAGANLPIRPRVTSFFDEARALFGVHDLAYTGSGAAWSVDTAALSVGSYVEPIAGFVTPRGTFRPFNIAFLAENMARRIDRWIQANTPTFAGHAWSNSPVEAEHYNGLSAILAEPRFANNVTAATRDRLVVILSSLALATPRPDASLASMLERLARPQTLGGLPSTMAFELADYLRRNGHELTADAFNEVVDSLQHGPPRCMDRTEYLGVYQQLRALHSAANIVLARPDTFARDDATWATIRSWMQSFGVPPVRAADGDAAVVDGVQVTNAISELITQTLRVLI
jgi:hypothetical protein